MATSTPALSPTAARQSGSDSLWLVVGLAAAFIPLFLLWQHLGSHFAGGDGKQHLTLIETYLRFAQWGATIANDPLAGDWNVGIPINVWINPALLPFSFLPADQAKIWTGAICYLIYAGSWYLVLRSAGAPLLRSIVIAQLAFVAFDPFYYLYGLPPNFALRPWISIIIALSFVVASLLLRIDNFRVSRVLTNSIAIAVIVIYGIVLDPLWALLILAIAPIPLAVVACERGLRPATAARWLALLLALAIVYASGPGRFLLLMSLDTSRYVETALNTYSQVPLYASSVFQYLGVEYIYAFMMIGWVLGLALCRGRARLLPIVAAITFAVDVIFTAVFLLANVRWIIPLPLYYQMTFIPWQVLGAGVGYGAGLWAIALRVSKLWQGLLTSTPAMLSAGRILGSLLCISLVPGYLTHLRIKADNLAVIVEPWGPQDMTAFLAKRLSLLDDPQFRGSAVTTQMDYIAELTADSLWRAFVPTVDENSEFVTEQLYVMLHDLLVKGDNWPTANHYPLYPSAKPGWLKSYVKVTQALGAMFIVSPTPLDFSSAFPPGTASLKEVQFPIGRQPGNWHVYELPAPNTGDYSPTVLTKLGTAPEMVAKMASPDFDFRSDAVVTEEVNEKLVPLKGMRLSFERGAARVQGVSEGTSLVLLPLQYSHCLRISDPAARLVRADLAMLGVIFKGRIDAEITDEFGTFTPGCRSADIADISRLKIALAPLDSPPTWGRPTAVKSVHDFLPNVMKILREIK